jgi:hypothetical protein
MPPFGTHDLHRPYSYLLAYAYGGGVNAFNLNGDGYINDATILAARLDYALAANLNLFGSFLWAQRNSHGYGWGYIRPSQEASVTRVVNPAGVGVDRITWNPTVIYRSIGGANPSPAIPDQDLGWEIQGGIDWKLLEKYRLSALVAYWQPGKWFNYACVDRRVPQWDVPLPANLWGVNPGRNIDAIIGWELRLIAEF